MQTKGMAIIIVLIVVVLGAGGYWWYSSHKTSSSTANSSSTQTQTAAVNNAVLKTANNAGVGQYLTDPEGKTLYTYEKDTSGTSNCTGSCLTNWPAYQDMDATADLPANVGTITRSDNGQKQFTYKGKPLYYFVQDSAAGQVMGNDVGDFYAAKP